MPALSQNWARVSVSDTVAHTQRDENHLARPAWILPVRATHPWDRRLARPRGASCPTHRPAGPAGALHGRPTLV